MKTQKIVLVVQDLKVKSGETIAVVSGDVHYHKTDTDETEYNLLTDKIKDEKDPDKKFNLETERMKYKTIASFQMSLDSNKNFQRHIKALVNEAISLKEKE